MKITHLAIALALSVGPLAFGAPITYTASLSGPGESPANSSPGTGFATVIFDSATHSLSISLTFSGLTSPTAASHIHCCTSAPFSGTAGVATQTPSFPGFPLGVTSGTFNNTFDTSLAASYNPAFVTANGGSVAATEQAFAAGLAANETYLNIHTAEFPGGEIRGFLVATPEPATLGLTAAAIGAFFALRRRSAKRNCGN